MNNLCDTTSETATKRYVLGSKPRLKVAGTDEDGVLFIPTESRLSIKEPSGTIITYSGGDMFVASGYLFIYYNPPTTGWYQYEGWVKDGNGLEDANTRGFEVYDLVYLDV